MLCGHDGELRRYLHLGERGEWRRRTARSCFVCRLVVKNLDLHAGARCDGGGAFVFYRYFSCSFVSARGLRLSGAGGDVGVGYAVLIFEWLTRVARGSNFF